jgi:hypothetical protein
MIYLERQPRLREPLPPLTRYIEYRAILSARSLILPAEKREDIEKEKYHNATALQTTITHAARPQLQLTMSDLRQQLSFRQSFLDKLRRPTSLATMKPLKCSHAETVQIPNSGPNQILRDGMSAERTSIPKTSLDTRSRNRELGSMNASVERVSAASLGRTYFVRR